MNTLEMLDTVRTYIDTTAISAFIFTGTQKILITTTNGLFMHIQYHSPYFPFPPFHFLCFLPSLLLVPRFYDPDGQVNVLYNLVSIMVMHN